jgi:two-component system chemotaxis sensor kinase CheA
VVVLTSRATEEDRRRGMEAGADGYLLKSAFDQGALIAAVQRLLGEAR